MNGNLAVLIGVILFFVLVAVNVTTNALHKERMACIDARGSLVGGACVFAPGTSRD